MNDDRLSRWGALDDVAIADARGLMNVPLRRDRMQWVKQSTRDAIRQFAAGVGDDNPLWHEPDYAATTRWGALLAPPSFLYAVDATIVAPKLPGVQWIYAGTRWRWFEPIRLNDDFEVEAAMVDMEEKSGRRFGRWVLQTGEIVYRRRHGALLAVAEGRVARTPRRERSENDHAPSRAAPTAAQALPEERPLRRGRETRWWEEVSVGDLVGPDVRSLGLRDVYAWYVGAQGALHYGGAHADAVRYRHRHDDFEINRSTGAKDSAARGHFSSAEGHRAGMGGAYDVGLHRISWFVAMLTDWMGDDGFLAELDVDVLGPNLVGDSTELTGKVREIRWHQQGFVVLDLEGRNQHGALTARGRGLVVLSSKRGGEVALPLFDGDPAGFRDFEDPAP